MALLAIVHPAVEVPFKVKTLVPPVELIKLLTVWVVPSVKVIVLAAALLSTVKVLKELEPVIVRAPVPLPLTVRLL